MKNCKSLLISISFVITFLLFIQLSFAQVRRVGVSEGDWFQYDLSLNFDSIYNITSEEFPFTDFLIGEQVILEIQNVSQNNVTGIFTTKYENGSEYLQTGSIDLITGEGDLRNWLISADLNVGDSLYVSEPEEMINETIIETYFWGARETNHLVYSYNFTSEDDYSHLSVDMFWDKEIGVVTELSFMADAYINGTIIDASAELLIMDSNILEDIPEFFHFTFILMIIIASFSIVLVKINRFKNRNL